MLKKIFIIIVLLNLFFQMACVKDSAAVNRNDSRYNALVIRVREKKRIQSLFDAIRQGNINEVKKYFDSGMAIDVRNRDNQTALYYAISRGKYNIAKFLIKKGADVNSLSTGNGVTPLYNASSAFIAKLLLENNANIEIGDITSGVTPLIRAATDDNEEVLIFLISKGANVNAKKKYGETALMIAARNLQLNILKILVKYGATINAITDYDISIAQNGTGFSTALDYAMVGVTSPPYDQSEVIKYLQSIGAKTFKELYPRGLPGRRSVTYQ